MKLNATAEMMAVTWPEFASLHPFVPLDQAAGYLEMFEVLIENSLNLTCTTGLLTYTGCISTIATVRHLPSRVILVNLPSEATHVRPAGMVCDCTCHQLCLLVDCRTWRRS